MTAARIAIDDRAVLEAVRTLGLAAANPDPAYREIGATITENVRLGFDQAEDPYGRPWKAVLRKGGHPLRDTGTLANSFTYRVAPDGVTIGSNLTVEHRGSTWNLATIHQHGATIRPRYAKALRFELNGALVTAQKTTIPARPMFPDRGWPDDWAEETLDIVAAHLTGGPP